MKLSKAFGQGKGGKDKEGRIGRTMRQGGRKEKEGKGEEREGLKEQGDEEEGRKTRE